MLGQYIDLLRALPKAQRSIAERKADKAPYVVCLAKQYGRDYFDGERKFGYGGYQYDGRWLPVARDIVAHYFSDKIVYTIGNMHWLDGGVRVLDVGCAKGFLVGDLHRCGSGRVHAFGLDISRYAVVEQPDPGVVGCLHLGTADELPFPDKSFDLVLSINTLHNLPRPRLIKALQEMRRVSRGKMFVQVDSYRTPAEKALFEDWVLTAEWHGYPEDWLALFVEAGYNGDYCWTIVE